jgi:hypothetical protein
MGQEELGGDLGGVGTRRVPLEHLGLARRERVSRAVSSAASASFESMTRSPATIRRTASISSCAGVSLTRKPRT